MIVSLGSVHVCSATITLAACGTLRVPASDASSPPVRQWLAIVRLFASIDHLAAVTCTAVLHIGRLVVRVAVVRHVISISCRLVILVAIPVLLLVLGIGNALEVVLSLGVLGLAILSSPGTFVVVCASPGHGPPPVPKPGVDATSSRLSSGRMREGT
ncbi:MAG: hypothetical protein J2P57_00650 [Acidimicrobiaceae bacterium]|nr:hypothetical protein [Acidimicrobiaceae bacterium]